MSSLDYLDLCRLCLVKDRVSVPIFDGEGDVRQIFLKIASCLPVKVAREDKLPKKICDDCVYKVELFYQFWNTTVNAEKQLLQWLGEVNLEDKQGYVTDVLNSGAMKEEQSTENRLDGNVIQHVGEHQNNMSMGMMDNMGLGIPIIISSANQQQQITSVPMDTSGSSVQTVQAVPGPSSQTTHNQIPQNRTSSTQHEDEEETEDEENSDEECDGDDGLNVKEESEDEPSNRTVEPTTFVNVPLVCDEAGPSGLQQQKISEIPEMPMPQSADEDPKSEYFVSKHQLLPRDEDECGANEMYEQVEEVEEELLDRLDVPKADNEQIIITEGIVQCSLCEDSFVSEQALAEHVQMHDEIVEVDEDYKEEMEQFVCEHCGCSFVTMPEFTKHQLEHEAENQEVEMCEEESLTAGQEVNIEYECEICNLSFDSYNGYEEHQTLHHSNDEKQFQCEICNATFRYRQGLRLHAKLHQPDYVPPQRKHHCELCNKRFSRRQVLLVHMKTHGNAGPQNEYVCPVCGKSVSSKTYLTVHLRKHTGEKPHVCDLCGKGFISQNYLSVHRRTHTGERPHKCTHCEKRFTQRTTLVVHLRGHTGDRPYPCTVCHKSFASKTMLNSHLKTHAKQTARQQQQEQQQIQNVQRQDQSLDTITILLPS